MIGKVFGSLKVLKETPKPEGKKGRGKWFVCECSCGKTVSVRSAGLKTGNTQSCGCSRIEDLSGMKLNRLTVIKQADKIKGNKRVRWLCQCECGEQITVNANNLKSGVTKSCGCLFDEYNENRRLDNIYSVDTGVVTIKDVNGNCFIISEEDYHSVIELDRYWYMRDKTVKGRLENYIETKIDGSTLKLHNFIMKPQKGELVDHINGVLTDNRRCNLRIVNTHQNAWNRAIPSSNTSGVKGVHYNSKDNKWVARIGYKGKRVVLGTFVNLSDATHSRIEAERKYYGEYSRISQVKSEKK